MENISLRTFQLETALYLDNHAKDYACLARKSLHMASVTEYPSQQIFWMGEYEKWNEKAIKYALKAAQIRETPIFFSEQEKATT